MLDCCRCCRFVFLVQPLYFPLHSSFGALTCACKWFQWTSANLVWSYIRQVVAAFLTYPWLHHQFSMLEDFLDSENEIVKCIWIGHLCLGICRERVTTEGFHCNFELLRGLFVASSVEAKKPFLSKVLIYFYVVNSFVWYFWTSIVCIGSLLSIE